MKHISPFSSPIQLADKLTVKSSFWRSREQEKEKLSDRWYFSSSCFLFYTRSTKHRLFHRSELGLFLSHFHFLSQSLSKNPYLSTIRCRSFWPFSLCLMNKQMIGYVHCVCFLLRMWSRKYFTHRGYKTLRNCYSQSSTETRINETVISNY